MVCKECGSVHSFCPQTTSSIDGKLTTVLHGMYPVKKGSKLALNTAILLWDTWGCIFEVNPQPFLFVVFF